MTGKSVRGSLATLPIGHSRPYPLKTKNTVTCDPTSFLLRLPHKTTPGHLRPYPPLLGENAPRSLATLPTQIGRVTSDHEPHSRHTFAFVRPYLTSFYPHFFSPLQTMLSTTTFLLSKTFLYHNVTPLCSPCFQLQHSFYQKHSFYQTFPPLCSPCSQLQHSFYQKHSFYQNFSPPSAAMLSTTTFLWSKTFLLSQFSPPPSAAHAFNYNIPFIKDIPFIKI